jgi:O-antigen/teichoic acid export membrane protein
LSLTKKLFSGSIFQIGNVFADILIGFFMMPFLISGLGEEWYGLWLLIGTVMGFFGLLTMGLMSAVQRYLSTENTPEKIIDYNETVNTALFIFVLAALASVVMSIAVGAMSHLFIDQEKFYMAFQTITFILGCNIALSFIVSPFRAMLSSDYQFTITGFADFLSLSIKASLTIIFIQNGFGIISLAVGTITSSIVSKILIVSASLVKIKKLRFGKKYLNKTKSIQLFRYSFKTFLSWIGDILRFSIDNLVISIFISLSAVTVYNIPIRLYNYASQFIVTSLGVLQPFFAQRVGEGNDKDIRMKFELAYGVSFALGGTLTAGLFVFGLDFINLWIGEYEEIKMLVYITPIMLLLAVSQNPCILILYAYNKHQYYAYQNIGEGIFNAIISIIAVQYYGIVGVAIGSLIPMFFTKLILQPRLSCQLIGFPLAKYYQQMFTCYGFVILASIIGTSLKTDINNWDELLINVFIFTALFIPAYWFLALNKATKSFFHLKLKSFKQ